MIIKHSKEFKTPIHMKKMEIKEVSSIKELNSVKKDSILKSQDPKLIRYILENKKIKAICSIEEDSLKDFMHSRNSNLNNIFCEIARKNNIGYAISISNLLNSKNKISLFGKIFQNIKLCKKHKVKIYILNDSNKNQKDLEAFSRFLNIHGEIIK